MIEMPFREEFSELFIRGINGKGNVRKVYDISVSERFQKEVVIHDK